MWFRNLLQLSVNNPRWCPRPRERRWSTGNNTYALDFRILCLADHFVKLWWPSGNKPCLLWSFCCYCSVVQSYPTLCDPMDCSSPGFHVLHRLLEFAQTHVHWVGDVTQPSHPLSPPSPPALNLSQHQGLFWWVCSSYHMKFWSFSFSIKLSNEYSGLIAFRIDCFDLLAVQRTLKHLLQYHSWKASVL